MPIYEYICQQCGHQFEVMQKISDDPLVICPECEAGALTKQISAPAFQLKGSGWYVTDFKNNKTPPATTDTKKSDTTKEGDK